MMSITIPVHLSAGSMVCRCSCLQASLSADPVVHMAAALPETGWGRRVLCDCGDGGYAGVSVERVAPPVKQQNVMHNMTWPLLEQVMHH